MNKITVPHPWRIRRDLLPLFLLLLAFLCMELNNAYFSMSLYWISGSFQGALMLFTVAILHYRRRSCLRMAASPLLLIIGGSLLMIYAFFGKAIQRSAHGLTFAKLPTCDDERIHGVQPTERNRDPFKAGKHQGATVVRLGYGKEAI